MWSAAAGARVRAPPWVPSAARTAATQAAPPHVAVPLRTQQRSARLATLYGALDRQDAAAVYDAFLGVAEAHTPLAAAEYRRVLAVLLAGGHATRPSTDPILVVLEHVKRAQKLYAHATAPGDVLVRDELTALLRDAYVWNALLTSARGRAKRLPLARLGTLLDLFVAAAQAVPPAAGPARDARTFPNVVSYNLLLHAIVRSLPAADAGRARAPPTSLHAARRELHAGRYTRSDAEAFFELVWARMAASCTPSRASWAIRALFYTQLRRVGAVQQCVRASVAAHKCSTALINTALGAYAAAHRADPALPARLGAVYEALRYRVLLAELGRAPPAAPDVDTRAVLGIDALPRGVLPDRGTYALLIRHLAQRGDLDGALRVLHDMIVTPGAPRGARADAPDAHGMAPGTDVYHAFFAAFARLGVPGRARVRGATPDAWVWDVPADAPWNVAAFAELFEGYLRVHPAHTPPRRTRARAPAPSPAQLYVVLVALRRVAGAETAWAAAQWARLVDKFGDAAHWDHFRLDARVERMAAALGAPRT